MAITLRRMERDGMIVRRPDPAHARRSFISLTPRGKELSQIMRRAALEVESVAYAGLTRKEIKNAESHCRAPQQCTTRRP
jgi:DNA-binding MarR family transcriptional regulator